MKKWTAFLLALALCGSLAACGGGNSTAAEDAADRTEGHPDHRTGGRSPRRPRTRTRQDAKSAGRADTDQRGRGSSPHRSRPTQGSGVRAQAASTTARRHHLVGDSGSYVRQHRVERRAAAARAAAKPSTGNSTASKPQTSTPAPAPAPSRTGPGARAGTRRPDRGAGVGLYRRLGIRAGGCARFAELQELFAQLHGRGRGRHLELWQLYRLYLPRERRRDRGSGAVITWMHKRTGTRVPVLLPVAGRTGMRLCYNKFTKLLIY